MEQEVNSLSSPFMERLKQNWKKYLIITIIVLVLIFLLYPRAYSYDLEDTCDSRIGKVSARCIGMRLNLLNYQEKTIGGELCSIDQNGQRCFGLSIFEELS